MYCTIEDEVPVFGKIIDVLVQPTGKCLFVVIPYIGDKYLNHYNTYEVRAANFNYLFYAPENLIDHHTLSLSKSFSQVMQHNFFVSLKYHVF